MTEPRQEDLVRAYAGTSVLITGHTGFKGAWLALWLSSLGAEVAGLALPPPTEPSLFADLRLHERCRHVTGDIRDPATVARAVASSAPRVIFHLAAQAIVMEGHRRPHETFETNVMGTANLLEAVRDAVGPVAIVIVTSDKCYIPDPQGRPRREDDALGGSDPYSASKAAAEIVAAAYRRTFFPPETLPVHRVAIATARAGNVIGGGDQAAERILPDAIRALGEGRPVPVRNPGHVRPWQHVLEPLAGYLLLGVRLMGADAARYCEAWNLGPRETDECTVGDLATAVVRAWGSGSWVPAGTVLPVRETTALRLDTSKAAARLGWHARWALSTSVARTVEWYRARQTGADATDLAGLCRRQIDEYMEAA